MGNATYHGVSMKNAKKGSVMPYSQATVYSVQLEDYVLKIHGQGWYDAYIQVPDVQAMETWQRYFNGKPSPDQSLSFRRENNNRNGGTAMAAQPTENHLPTISIFSQDFLLSSRRTSGQTVKSSTTLSVGAGYPSHEMEQD
ncbi:hypothetical protein DFQ30_007243 [Apophysomyces sp. BC1015]|nr:hypothetical protein DFQ30_007243 [Apophysomyces sp. BC1015]